MSPADLLVNSLADIYFNFRLCMAQKSPRSAGSSRSTTGFQEVFLTLRIVSHSASICAASSGSPLSAS